MLCKLKINSLIILVCGVILCCLFTTNKAIGEGEQEEVTIRLLEWGATVDFELMSSWLKKFNEKYPHIKVERIQTMWGVSYMTKLQVMVSGGDYPDVIFIPSRSLPVYAHKGTLLALDDLVRESSEELNMNDFIPGTVDLFKYQGILYGMPKDISVQHIYYNAELFDEEGIDYPNDDWTWDDFHEAAIALTKDTDYDGRTDQFGYLRWDYDDYFKWAPILISRGGRFVDDKATKCYLDSPESIEAMGLFSDYYRKYKTTPISQADTVSRQGGFRSGKIGMIISGNWDIMGNNYYGCDFEWDVALTPKGSHGRASMISSMGFAIPKGSKNPNEAWTLIKYLVSQEAQELLGASCMNIPVRQSALPSYVNSDAAPEHIEKVVESVKYCVTFPPFDKWDQVFHIIVQYMPLVDLGQMGIEQACTKITEEIDSIFNESDFPREEFNFQERIKGWDAKKYLKQSN